MKKFIISIGIVLAKSYVKLSEVLKRLLYEHRITPSDLARETNLPIPTVHRLTTGKTTRPYRSSLEPIAKYFDITVEQLLGEASLPATLHSAPFAKKHDHLVEIPLITWKDLDKPPSREEAQQTIVSTNDVSTSAFAVPMNDSSMEPYFSSGTLLILDPDKPTYDRCFVLVKLGESKLFIVRQLLIDADHQFLKPLNPDSSIYKMRLLDKNDKIIAVLVEARQVYQSL